MPQKREGQEIISVCVEGFYILVKLGVQWPCEMLAANQGSMQAIACSHCPRGMLLLWQSRWYLQKNLIRQEEPVDGFAQGAPTATVTLKKKKKLRSWALSFLAVQTRWPQLLVNVVSFQTYYEVTWTWFCYFLVINDTETQINVDRSELER